MSRVRTTYLYGFQKHVRSVICPAGEETGKKGGYPLIQKGVCVCVPFYYWFFFVFFFCFFFFFNLLFFLNSLFFLSDPFSSSLCTCIFRRCSLNLFLLFFQISVSKDESKPQYPTVTILCFVVFLCMLPNNWVFLDNTATVMHHRNLAPQRNNLTGISVTFTPKAMSVLTFLYLSVVLYYDTQQ